MGTFKRLDLSLNVTSSQNFHTEYMLKGIIFDSYISKFNQFMMKRRFLIKPRACEFSAAKINRSLVSAIFFPGETHICTSVQVYNWWHQQRTSLLIFRIFFFSVNLVYLSNFAVCESLFHREHASSY